MPKSVAWFERLTYGAILVGMINLYPLWRREFAQDPAGEQLIVLAALAVGVGLWALCIWLIARRRKNWARWLLLVLVIAGVPNVYKAMAGDIQSYPIEAALTVIQFLLQAVTFVLVFSNDAKPWFARPTPPVSAEAPQSLHSS